ncbi:hypothetical protein RDWZM_005769 [Blomia tropicalis]|uniref:Translocon-associated protein subunit beta n=1 Tax=Blomia tropicalis TaxID=40697 RepID=A0A9Q0M8D0_BLOTA|nr:SWI/SNF and RSC complex subunit Ssr2 [Blomia tropicalis]KAJ6219957.1 hypothetical protein RDWZM_005769 [Blomia tropicalis]
MNSFPFIGTFVLLCLAYLANSEDASTPARLLVEKQVLNKFLVESKDILVHYNIFNVGGSPATNVHISDATFSLTQFEIINGALKFTIPRIAPLSNVTHSVVVRPQEGVRGRFNFTAGEITYLSEGSNDLQIGFTSEPGEGFIVSLKEFNKKFSPHYSDWATFLLISMSTVLFPYFLWYNSKTKYEALSAKKNK